MEEGQKFYAIYTVTNAIYNGFIIFSEIIIHYTLMKFLQKKNVWSNVMHGAILSGCLSNFIRERLTIKNVLVQTYQLYFLKPVYINIILDLRQQ